MKYILENQETNRIRFREVRKSDFDVWLEFHKNPNTSLYWISNLESPEIECAKWYEKQNYRYKNTLGGMNALIEKESGKLIGHCGLLIQTVDEVQELEIGYSLLPEYWNKGFATEAAMKCRNYAFENNLASSVISIISLTNIPSQKVAIKLGMEVDKATDYNNNRVNIYRIHKSEWDKIGVV